MMRNKVLFFTAVVIAAVARIKGGQVKTVCILIPSYNPEDYAEGESEEEEAHGWGPGDSKTNTGVGSLQMTHHGEGEGESEAGTGQGEAPSPAGTSRGSMTDPSKPPGPNPKWGYWEWDSESGMWELEDFRRKKRQAVGGLLPGKLQCGPGSIIHVDKVMLGFSADNHCRPVRPTCQVMAPTIEEQVSRCEGHTGVCAISVLQTFMEQCGRTTNYAKIQYECIAESERHNICMSKEFISTGSLVFSSPSFSGSVTGADKGHYLSCECEITRGVNTALAIPWASTRLDTTSGGQCGEELLLLDTWSDSANRFTLQEELCGLKSVRDKSYSNSVLKLTYIPSSTNLISNGFLLKVEGKPNHKAQLEVKCSVLSAEDGPSNKSHLQLPPPSQVKPQLPGSFDISKYPGLLNKTIAAFRNSAASQSNQQESNTSQTGEQGTKASQTGQQGSSASQTGEQDSKASQAGTAGAVVQQDAAPSSDQFNVSGMSGTLSAVVASLCSIIVIMASVGIFLWYRRSQKKKQQTQRSNIYLGRSSTVRSDVTLYEEPTYQDPDFQASGVPIPFPLPASSTGKDGQISQSQTTSLESSQKSARLARGDGQAPALPLRPPRSKKEKFQRLPIEEEVPYDNPGCDIKVVQDTDYASLNEISEALGSQDSSVQIAWPFEDKESEWTEDINEAELIHSDI